MHQTDCKSIVHLFSGPTGVDSFRNRFVSFFRWSPTKQMIIECLRGKRIKQFKCYATRRMCACVCTDALIKINIREISLFHQHETCRTAHIVIECSLSEFHRNETIIYGALSKFRRIFRSCLFLHSKRPFFAVVLLTFRWCVCLIDIDFYSMSDCSWVWLTIFRKNEMINVC